MNTTAKAMQHVIRQWDEAGARQVTDIQRAASKRWLAKHTRPMPATVIPSRRPTHGGYPEPPEAA